MSLELSPRPAARHRQSGLVPGVAVEAISRALNLAPVLLIVAASRQRLQVRPRGPGQPCWARWDWALPSVATLVR